MCMLHAQNAFLANLHHLQGLHYVQHAPLGTIPKQLQVNAYNAQLGQQLPSQEHLSASNVMLARFLLRMQHLFVFHACLEPILCTMQQLAPPAHQEQEGSSNQRQVPSLLHLLIKFPPGQPFQE